MDSFEVPAHSFRRGMRTLIPKKCPFHDDPDKSQAQLIGHCRINDGDIIRTRCGVEFQSCKKADALMRVLLEREKGKRGKMARYLLGFKPKLSFHTTGRKRGLGTD